MGEGGKGGGGLPDNFMVSNQIQWWQEHRAAPPSDILSALTLTQPPHTLSHTPPHTPSHTPPHTPSHTLSHTLSYTHSHSHSPQSKNI